MRCWVVTPLLLPLAAVRGFGFRERILAPMVLLALLSCIVKLFVAICRLVLIVLRVPSWPVVASVAVPRRMGCCSAISYCWGEWYCSSFCQSLKEDEVMSGSVGVLMILLKTRRRPYRHLFCGELCCSLGWESMDPCSSRQPPSDSM